MSTSISSTFEKDRVVAGTCEKKKFDSKNVSQSFFIKNVYGENNVLTASSTAASTAKGYAICYFLYFLFALLCSVSANKSWDWTEGMQDAWDKLPHESMLNISKIILINFRESIQSLI